MANKLLTSFFDTISTAELGERAIKELRQADAEMAKSGEPDRYQQEHCFTRAGLHLGFAQAYATLAQAKATQELQERVDGVGEVIKYKR
jgi:hypothetical protein